MLNLIQSKSQLFLILILLGQIGYTQPYDNNQYTSKSQLGLTITNYGVLGNGWNLMENGQIHPSSQYKQHTEILQEQVEHFAHVGLWVGGVVNGESSVSTAILDGYFEPGQEGFEFFPTSEVDTTSIISHQDFITGFKDFGDSTTDSNSIPNHIPLGIQIELKCFSWDFPPVNSFVILEYDITNHSTENIENLFLGIWVDAAVANMNYTNIYTPGGGFTWYDNLNGFDESVDNFGFTRDIGYQYDADGDDGWSESYIGISSLGSNIPKNLMETNYHQWVWATSNNSDYPDYTMPINDSERYEKLNWPKLISW